MSQSAYTETQPKTPKRKECRCRSTVARKNSLERHEPRKEPGEEPGSEGWPVLFWLCRFVITRVHGHFRPDCSSRCSNVHRCPAGWNNNHSGCRGLQQVNLSTVSVQWWGWSQVQDTELSKTTCFTLKETTIKFLAEKTPHNTAV